MEILYRNVSNLILIIGIPTQCLFYTVEHFDFKKRFLSNQKNIYKCTLKSTMKLLPAVIRSVMQ